MLLYHGSNLDIKTKNPADKRPREQHAKNARCLLGNQNI